VITFATILAPNLAHSESGTLCSCQVPSRVIIKRKQHDHLFAKLSILPLVVYAFSYMPDQTYPQALTPRPNASQQPTEPEQVDTGTATEAKKKELTTELGGTGTTIVGGFLTGQDYNPDFTGTRRINLFDEMRLSDATVRAGLNMVKLPILSADWYIKGEHEESREFADKQLLKNPHFTWTAFLRQALTMCDNGNSIFEKIFEQIDGGKIGWKRFSPRMSKTIYRWTLNDGVSPGIYQILPTGKTAEIPRWKLLYFINEQEGSNYEGISSPCCLQALLLQEPLLQDRLYSR
jgi:hypothetical protein